LNDPNDNKGIFYILKQKHMCLILCGAGLFISLPSLLLKSKGFSDLAINASSSIGSILLTAGIIDLVLSISTIKKYINDVLNKSYEVCNLLKLYHEVLKKLRRDITVSILRKHFLIDEDDKFLNELSDSALSIVLLECYIKEYEVEIYFSFEGSYIKKRIVKRINYVNAGSRATKIEPIDTKYMIDIPGETIFNISECKVNGEPFVVETGREPVTDGSHGIYNIKCFCDFSYEIAKAKDKDKRDVWVEFTTDLLLPRDDIKSTIALRNPCEKFKIDYFYEPDGKNEVQLSGNVFCYDTKTKLKKSSSNHHLQMRVDGSMLPGEGAIVYFQIL
jgi:hypothetical protein